jgi:hypothetical protein
VIRQEEQKWCIVKNKKEILCAIKHFKDKQPIYISWQNGLLGNSIFEKLKIIDISRDVLTEEHKAKAYVWARYKAKNIVKNETDFEATWFSFEDRLYIQRCSLRVALSIAKQKNIKNGKLYVFNNSEFGYLPWLKIKKSNAIFNTILKKICRKKRIKLICLEAINKVGIVKLLNRFYIYHKNVFQNKNNKSKLCDIVISNSHNDFLYNETGSESIKDLGRKILIDGVWPFKKFNANDLVNEVQYRDKNGYSFRSYFVALVKVTIQNFKYLLSKASWKSNFLEDIYTRYYSSVVWEGEKRNSEMLLRTTNARAFLVSEVNTPFTYALKNKAFQAHVKVFEYQHMYNVFSNNTALHDLSRRLLTKRFVKGSFFLNDNKICSIVSGVQKISTTKKLYIDDFEKFVMFLSGSRDYLEDCLEPSTEKNDIFFKLIEVLLKTKKKVVVKCHPTWHNEDFIDMLKDRFANLVIDYTRWADEQWVNERFVSIFPGTISSTLVQAIFNNQSPIIISDFISKPIWKALNVRIEDFNAISLDLHYFESLIENPESLASFFSLNDYKDGLEVLMTKYCQPVKKPLEVIFTEIKKWI